MRKFYFAGPFISGSSSAAFARKSETPPNHAAPGGIIESIAAQTPANDAANAVNGYTTGVIDVEKALEEYFKSLAYNKIK